MRRRAALVAVWLLGTAASVALAWTAVSAVGGHVTNGPAGDLTAAEVADAADAPTTSSTSPVPTSTSAVPPTTTSAPASPIPATSSTSTPVASTAAPPTPTTAPPETEATSTQTFQSQGGSVGVTCVGSQASLEFASPAGGYATEVHDAGPEQVDVRFESDELDRESRIVVRCSNGTPSADVREDDDE